MKLKCVLLLLVVHITLAKSQFNWKGETSDFTFFSDTIQLNAEAQSSNKSIYIASNISADGFWEFNVTMDFNPSGSNLCRLYLCADDSIYSGIKNGLYVECGSSNDNISLHRVVNGQDQLLIEGAFKRLDKVSNSFGIKVNISEEGTLTLYYNTEDATTIKEGSYEGLKNLKSDFFVIYCKFTSTRSKLFSFSSLKIEGKANTDTIVDPKTIELFDVVINEVLADPTPFLFYENEYIELYNRTTEVVNLSALKLIVNNSTVSLPNYELSPRSYVVISKYELNDLNGLYVNNFPNLPNSQFNISLINNIEGTVDAFNYSSTLHKEPYKQEGGWSIERIDADHYQLDNNWASCIDYNGGTPGAINSISSANPDNELPKVLYVFPIDSSTIQITFNEPIKNLVCYEESRILNVQFIENHSIANIKLTNPFNNRTQELFVENLSDFNNNEIQFALKVGIPQPLSPETIIINEIMFNPDDESDEFIELYNNSELFINISDIYLSKRNNNGLLEPLIPISEQNHIIAPSSYITISKNPLKNNIIEYPTSNFAVDKFPTLGNELGSIIITNAHAEIIDEIYYSDSWHNSNFKDVKGFSLERISNSLPTNAASSWTSASVHIKSTPGQENSQRYIETPANNDRVTVSSDYITTNGDGYNDFALIKTHYPGEYSLTITIYSREGILVKELCNNQPSYNSTTHIWDGMLAEKNVCKAGIYIIMATIQAPHASQTIKKVITVN